jgi:poly-beta-1,6-N-acetyl-D-glucosamine synthase
MFALFILTFLILLTVYALLIERFRVAWNRIPLFTVPDTAPVTTVSIVIALRNESGNIDKLLNSLQQQDYPSALWEIVLVDDFSTDDTAEKIRHYNGVLRGQIKLIQMKAIYPDDTVVQSHKKRALEAGIGVATGSLIITTDADCTMGALWLRTHVQFQESTGARFIAAPVKIAPATGFLGRFQSLDFLTLQGITGAAVFQRSLSMCNGANLLYTREAFMEVRGFEGIDALPSGDDMFLMHKIYTKYPNSVYYLKHEDAIVTTAPALNWKAFFHQRIRWASKADHYDDKRIFRVLLCVYLVNLCFLILLFWILFLPRYWTFLLLFFTAKLLIEFPFVQSVARFFNLSKLMPWFPAFQPFHILYTLIAGWLGKFGSYQWKGRTIKKTGAAA